MTTGTKRLTVEEIETWIYMELALTRGTPLAVIREEIASGDSIDSLEGLEIAIAAEAPFGIRIEDRELPIVCGSVQKLATLIVMKLGAAGVHQGGVHEGV